MLLYLTTFENGLLLCRGAEVLAMTQQKAACGRLIYEKITLSFHLFMYMESIGKRERIVVIGGGFAGLNFVRKIDKRQFDVTLVDRNNFHSFPPLFYQVASSGLEPASISFPFRREMRRRIKGVDYHMGDVSEIDMTGRTVRTQFETIPFDRLVIAAGTTNNFFGDESLRERVFTLKTTAEALRCRNEILDRLERASLCADSEHRRQLLSFVVIGGGPAGVEIAGAIGEMKRYIIKREYPSIDPSEMSIILLEGTDRLLRAMSATASREALNGLGKLMVDVKLGVMMKSYNDGIIELSDGSRIDSGMVIWTAGITGEAFKLSGTDVKPGRGGRFATDDHCRVEGLDRVYAVGDIGCTLSDAYPHGFPQLAQVAIQQAVYLAGVLNGEFDRPFMYKDKGTMATIGRNRAVADLKHIHLTGFPAWVAWMFVHLITLLGMRNKVVVLINWMWSYFTYNTSLRLLIHTARYPLRQHWRR